MSRRHALVAVSLVLCVGALQPTTATANVPTSTAPAATAPGDITIAFGGDVHFERQLASRLVNPTTSLASLRSWVGAADITMVNLETAITSRGTPAPKHYHFRTTPSALVALRGAGVDVITMANNHAVDYGSVGLGDTVRAVEHSPIPVVGIGRDSAHAYAPFVATVRGVRIAIFGADDASDWTTSAHTARSSTPGIAAIDRSRDSLVKAIRAWSPHVNAVVVYLHGGVERHTCPTSRQRSTAAVLAAAGADVVVTSHAHVLLGEGWSGRTFVSHGLGNFLWYSANSVREGRSGLLTVRLRAGRAVAATLTPSATGRDGLPHRIDGAAATALFADLRSLTRCAGLASLPPS
jgi:poly-gamma-glutamate synthesis protein (capsule biosynthesis protein)